MKFGISVINFASYGDPKRFVEIACEAEKAGWDGFFPWDHLLVFYPEPVVPFIDPWIGLAAVAARTQRIRLGPMITPLPRRRPWKVAREATSLDHLSDGRLTLGVGLGNPPEADFKVFGEETDWVVRAEKLEESLDILMGLWSGKPFSHKGKHYQLDTMTFLPTPVQKPCIPIWGAGAWPRKGGFRRAARLDGIIPMLWKSWDPVQPRQFKEILAYIKRYRKDLSDFDIVGSGEVVGTENDVEILQSYADAGCTWWLDIISDRRGTYEEMLNLVRQGPPKS
jgi:alkanesulfonate monooxygenase SsuD/methylene tetrahydromethanopterin reductase-like flavin-dependent oxidoreductase (luciferase family)